MPPLHLGGKLKFFGHMCREGICPCPSRHVEKKMLLGKHHQAAAGIHQLHPNDKMLEKEKQQSS